MKDMWLFRSNIPKLENYHSFKTLVEFKEKCHDFYLLMGIWFLENKHFDKFVVWRLQPKKRVEDKTFIIENREFIQKFVDDFSECFEYPKPSLTFFRGGFECYDKVVRTDQKFFSPSLYLGAGRRLFPQYNGKYDTILLESESDFNNKYNCLSFYKTTNSNIFKPLNYETKKYDLCWPCNFSSIRYKGQKFFISSVSNSKFLRGLKIVHSGNNPEVGKKLCKKYNVNNIKFMGWLERPKLNKLLNQSKFGIVTSNQNDGCPRISIEILNSGTPLLIRDQTRLLNYYKKSGVVKFSDNKIEAKIEKALLYHSKFQDKLLTSIENELSFDIICKKNWELWTKRVLSKT